MPLIPRDTFVFESAEPPAVVHDRLIAAVAPRRLFQIRNSGLPFKGQVDGDSFRIVRIIQGRNSFRPELSGRIVATAGGTRVEGTMRLRVSVVAFLIVWMFALVVMTGPIAIAAFPERSPLMFVPVGMLMGVVSIVVMSFNYEARLSREALRKVVMDEKDAPPRWIRY